MNKIIRKIGMTIGLLMLTAALFLALYNLHGEQAAQKTTEEAVNMLQRIIPEPKPVPAIAEPAIPMEMPEAEVNGQRYIGTLELPTLELTLGVISHWDAARLQIAPCRYTGSTYTDDLVIAGHNYYAHFGRLHQLQPGDRVIFTDAEGATQAYQVVLQEILQPEDVEEMTSGDWELTLFTCTVGGENRVTVRCQRLHEYVHEDKEKETGRNE